MDAQNTLVVVTRWFGGVKLGGDRWRHINNAARNAIEMGTKLKAATQESHNPKIKQQASRLKHAKDKKK